MEKSSPYRYQTNTILRPLTGKKGVIVGVMETAGSVGLSDVTSTSWLGQAKLQGP